MAWYVERANAPSSYARDAEALRRMESVPPVVFAAPEDAETAAPVLEERGYEQRSYDLGLYHEQTVVVFVDHSRLGGATDRSVQSWPESGVRRA
jgi:hypothetical protein